MGPAGIAASMAAASIASTRGPGPLGGRRVRLGDSYPRVVNSHEFELIWGGVALVGGGLLAANVRGVADRFQAMSYAYRSWPGSVTTCRVIGGVFAFVGAGILIAAGV